MNNFLQALSTNWLKIEKIFRTRPRGGEGRRIGGTKLYPGSISWIPPSIDSAIPSLRNRSRFIGQEDKEGSGAIHGILM